MPQYKRSQIVVFPAVSGGDFLVRAVDGYGSGLTLGEYPTEAIAQIVRSAVEQALGEALPILESDEEEAPPDPPVQWADPAEVFGHDPANLAPGFSDPSQSI